MQKFITALLAFGPLGFLVLCLVDSLGIPLPGAIDFLLVAFAAKEPDRAYLGALAAVIGSTAGNVILFQAACQGSRFFLKEGPSSVRGQKFQQWFHRYGMATIFIPAVTPVLPFPLKVFVVSAGCLRVSFAKFLTVVLAARVIRYFGEAYLGVQLGADAKAFLLRNTWPLLGAAVALVTAIYFVIRYNERRGESVL